MLAIRSLIQARILQGGIAQSRVVQAAIRGARQRTSRTLRLRVFQHLSAVRNRRRQSGWRHIAAKQLTETITQLVDTQIALDLARNCQADAARFLGNDHRDRIGLLSYTNACAMPRSQLGGEHRVHRQRQKAGGGGYPVALHDYSAIVEGSARPKDRCQQIIRQPCVEWNAAFDISTQPNLTLDNDQSARLVLAKQ